MTIQQLYKVIHPLAESNPDLEVTILSWDADKNAPCTFSIGGAVLRYAPDGLMAELQIEEGGQ